MRSLLATSAAVIPLLAAGCTAPGDPATASARSDGRECFLAANVNSFTPVDDEAVVVRAGVDDHYRLEFLGPCPDIDWSQTIALRTRGSSWVCRGLDADIYVRDALGPRLCPVRAVRKLTDAEVEALRAR